MTRSIWWWPIIIIALAIGAGLAVVSNMGFPIRPVITFMFLLICPGMAFVRLLHIQERLTELILAIALSIAMSTILAEIMVYAKVWSPKWGLFVLIGLSVIGVIFQIIELHQLQEKT